MNKRIDKEFNDLVNKPIDGVKVEKCPEVTNKWILNLTGPPNSVYEGANFKVSCTFPDNYPFKMPEFKFDTLIWHLNVTEEGEMD